MDRKHAFEKSSLKKSRKCKVCRLSIETSDAVLLCKNNCAFKRIHEHCLKYCPTECRSPEVSHSSSSQLSISPRQSTQKLSPRAVHAKGNLSTTVFRRKTKVPSAEGGMPSNVASVAPCTSNIYERAAYNKTFAQFRSTSDKVSKSLPLEEQLQAQKEKVKQLTLLLHKATTEASVPCNEDDLQTSNDKECQVKKVAAAKAKIIIKHELKRAMEELENLKENNTISEQLFANNIVTKIASSTEHTTVPQDMSTDLSKQMELGVADAASEGFKVAKTKTAQLQANVEQSVIQFCALKEALKFTEHRKLSLISSFKNEIASKNEKLQAKRAAWQKVCEAMEQQFSLEEECLNTGECLLDTLQSVSTNVRGCSDNYGPLLQQLTKGCSSEFSLASNRRSLAPESPKQVKLSKSPKASRRNDVVKQVTTAQKMCNALIKATNIYYCFDNNQNKEFSICNQIFNNHVNTDEEIQSFSDIIQQDNEMLDELHQKLESLNSQMKSLDNGLSKLEDKLEDGQLDIASANTIVEITDKLAYETKTVEIEHLALKEETSSTDDADVEVDDAAATTKAKSSKVIKAASIASMIKVLTSTSDVNTIDFQVAFFTSFRYYLSPLELLEKLVQVYCNSPIIANTVAGVETHDIFRQQVYAELTKKRILILLQFWLYNYYEVDFKEENSDKCKCVIHMLSTFLNETVATTGYPTQAAQLQQLLEKQQHRYTLKRERLSSVVSDLALTITKEVVDIDFFTYSPFEFALTLSMEELNIYRQLSWNELTGQLWSKKKTQHLAPNVIQLVNHFNGVSNLVINAILKQDTAIKRASLIKLCIAIALQFLRLNNYSGCVQIVSGLNNTSIQRLTHTWSIVGQHLFEVKERLATLLKGNFTLLRKQLDDSSLPAVPYIGLFLKDLTFTEDGNKTFTTVEDTKNDVQTNVINFSKFRKISNVIQQALTYKKSDYFNTNVIDLLNFSLIAQVRNFIYTNSQANEVEKANKQYAISKKLEPSTVTSNYPQLKFTPPTSESSDPAESSKQLNALKSHALLIKTDFNATSISDRSAVSATEQSTETESKFRQVSNRFSLSNIGTNSCPVADKLGSFVAERRQSFFDSDTASERTRNTTISNSSATDVLLFSDADMQEEELKIKYLEEITGYMSNPISGVTVKNRKWRLHKYPSCFIAKEAVDWIMKNLEVATRVEAVAIAQDLVNYNFIRHVTDDHIFKDKYLFFQFVDRSKLVTL